MSDGAESMEEEVEVMYAEDMDELVELEGIEVALEGADDGDDPDSAASISQGDEIFMFTGHKKGAVFCGTLSRDGKWAVTGDENDEAYLWNTSSGEIRLECTGHKDSVTFAEFNHDESYLATGDMIGTIQVWKLADNTRVWDFAMGDCIWMKWHIAGNILLAGSAVGDVYMWKIPDGTCKIFEGFGHRSDAATLFSDGKRIAVGYADGTLRVIELKTSNVLITISPKFGHCHSLTALDCHPDSNLILSADVGGKTILSTATTGKIVSVLQQFPPGDMSDEVDNWVEAAVFCRDPIFQVAATGTITGEIFLWDVPKQVLRHKIQQESGISKLAWKGTTSLLFSGGLDGVLRCYDARSGQCLRLYKGHTVQILDVSISANGERALTTSDDSTARIFDITS